MMISNVRSVFFHYIIYYLLLLLLCIFLAKHSLKIEYKTSKAPGINHILFTESIESLLHALRSDK
jgi:hypothetical protein